MLILIPSGPHSVAATLVNPLIPYFAAAYDDWPSLPNNPAPDAKLITDPLVSLRYGCANFIKLNTAYNPELIAKSKSSFVCSISFNPDLEACALLINTSILPNSSTILSIAPFTWSS